MYCTCANFYTQLVLTAFHMCVPHKQPEHTLAQYTFIKRNSHYSSPGSLLGIETGTPQCLDSYSTLPEKNPCDSEAREKSLTAQLKTQVFQDPVNCCNGQKSNHLNSSPTTHMVKGEN